ncbi:rRNA-processing protein utp23 [Neolecta irregularis DAH-3]|uniref:U three protein 23 n=1 Tax=Neolecta irregularis (strain DAH-3) TaxID=1198029 RepID=A0A1U7LIW8_NEOID|nr:rRNA-processing protein utp23 [Neolecta irregularis DAH-3]|eukprot:OLL22589.1 rRNA-processing protein utp23 [Neolecta irregularis DAH-3]
MKLKRQKSNKKLLHLYQQIFSFREPFQVIVDADIISTAVAQKLELWKALERTLQGQVKPMITQCAMQVLYVGKNKQQIELGKEFERRRCNHFEDPKSPFDCISEITKYRYNRNRYIVCTNNVSLRSELRNIPGVPLVYIKRGVMILEPASPATLNRRKELEEEKLGVDEEERRLYEGGEPESKISNKKKRAKGANPLSVRKKMRVDDRSTLRTEGMSVGDGNGHESKNRRRKKHSKLNGTENSNPHDYIEMGRTD